MLEKELLKFKEVQPDLLLSHPQGGFVVIKEESVLGVWADRMDAIQEGVKVFGTEVSFLVKNIQDSENAIINFSRNIPFCNAVSIVSPS